MKILPETALTYDDVLLVPQYSSVDSRRMLSTQARHIERVKKAESFVVEKPITMPIAHTVGDLKKLIDETGTGGILILHGDEKLVGVVTTRDLIFEEDYN